MFVNEKFLRKKGWTSEEIAHVNVRFRKFEKKKSLLMKVLENVLYWIFLLFTLATNILVSYALIPILLLIHSSIVYLIIGFIAFAFGILFSIVIKDIEHLSRMKHAIFSFLVCTISLFNFGIVIKQANMISVQLSSYEHNSLLIAIVYVFFFMLPYVYFITVKRRLYGAARLARPLS